MYVQCVFYALLVIGFTFAEESKITEPVLKKAYDECINEQRKEKPAENLSNLNVTEEEYLRACMTRCIGIKSGFLNSNGTANIELTLQFIELQENDKKSFKERIELAREALEHCETNYVVSEDDCLTSYNFFDCTDDKMKKLESQAQKL